MTTPEKYEKIKEAVFKFCPGLIVCEEITTKQKGGKILGHEINLEHVLKTINNSEFFVSAYGFFYEGSGGVKLGQLPKPGYSVKDWAIVPRYELGKPLSWHLENRPEVVEFLYDILFPQAK